MTDAKRFFELLTNPNFGHLLANPKTLNEEIRFLKQNAMRRKKRIAFNYTIVYKNKIVGAIGLNMSPLYKHVGEIGYFVEEALWGKGIASQAVKEIEKLAFNKFKLKRITIVTAKSNKASAQVAIKNGYKKEGVLKKGISSRSRKYIDAYLFAKVK